MTSKNALRLLACITLFALSGCGLSPVYGTYAKGGKNDPVAAALDHVYIDSIADRSGQKLRNALMDRFYRTGRKDLASAQYRLRVNTIVESIYGLGIAKDATATRSQIKLVTSFALTRVGDPQAIPLITRTVESISSFDTLASEYTTLVSADDARDQVIRDMADQITTLLELYFANPGKFQAETLPQNKAPVLIHDPRAHISDQLKGY